MFGVDKRKTKLSIMVIRGMKASSWFLFPLYFLLNILFLNFILFPYDQTKSPGERTSLYPALKFINHPRFPPVVDSNALRAIHK